MDDGSDYDGRSDDASSGSEDSREPYFHVITGRTLPAREAWGILAAEGHPRYARGGKRKRRGGGDVNVGPSSAPRTPAEEAPSPTTGPPPPATPPPLSSDEGEPSSTFSAGPTQSSIDRALHPESPNYLTPGHTPGKDLKPSPKYKKSSSYEGSSHLEIPPSESEDELEDPVVLRATAMALAAQNGQKLTPEQMALIARPDVQQQKLIEEAKRIQKAKDAQKAKEMQDQLMKQLSAPVDNLQKDLQRVGADFKKFIQEEKEKGEVNPLQWGADLGKFIETQASTRFGGNEGENGSKDGPGDGRQGGKEGDNGEDSDSKPGSLPSSAVSSPSPRGKKKMEGFGTDPSALHPSPNRRSSEPSSPPTKGILWPVAIPPLPLPTLNEGIVNMLPGGVKRGEANDDAVEELRISGILWKRRSGFGKHSTSRAWERRRVELRGTRLVYYKTQEEEEEEAGEGAISAEAPLFDASNNTDNTRDGDGTPRETTSADGGSRDPGRPPSVGEPTSLNDDTNAAPSVPHTSLLSGKHYSRMFDKAAQAAEQHLGKASESLARFASAATGIDALRPSSADTPRGTLDLLKERAFVGVSMGHSGAPTPFCLSVKVKGETKWKFCFDGRGALMEWMAALADVLVEASTAAKNEGGDEEWEMEGYCIRRGAEKEEGDGEGGLNTSVVSALSLEDAVDDAAATGADISEDGGWAIVGTKLQVGWAAANLALIVARSSLTSIDRYWTLVVFFNVGIWQLCTRAGSPSSKKGGNTTTLIGSRRRTKPAPSGSKITSVRKTSFKPVAGSSTVQVAKSEDVGFNKNGDQLPSWVAIPPSVMDVRSHGYLTTRKKIPCPGELYECVAVDCFVSDNRFAEIAPRVRLPDAKFDDAEFADGGKPWRSPDMFVASIALPTEPPRFGHGTDDGPGLTFVGYFKMKEETRRILRQIHNGGNDPATMNDDVPDPEQDVQKRIVNGVRLWERYCRKAPSDPSFQARFKLIPAGNLVELGCPLYIAKYNGKPVLIKRNRVTGFFDDHRQATGADVMEFDISLHPFPYLFKQAMAYLKDNFDKTMATFGFVIEGRSDEELPEVVIGAMQVCRPSPKYTVKGEDFFGGTCPKSSRAKPETRLDSTNE